MIEVRGLTKSYEGHPAVQDISFTVERGDIYGFIGPNGAGKTTTIRIISTLLDPSGGDVCVSGHSVVSDPMRVRQALGYMPDLFQVYERITVWEYLDFFGGAYGLPRAQRRRVIEDILVLTDLAGVRDRLSQDLSKGMKQRLCLARTLLHDPQVLVLDEPASGLDPRARIEFRALLKELRRMGKTILLSSHILTELSDVCNAVAIMERGRIVAAGTLEAIKERFQPRRAYSLRVLDRAGEARQILEESGVAIQVREHEGAISFLLDGDEPLVAGLVKALALKDIPVVALQEQRQDLEKLFMELTRGEVA